MPYKSLGLLLLATIPTRAIIADPVHDYAVRQTSCSIEMSMYRSPHHYLVAVVEHPGELQCREGVCVETLSIVRVLGSGSERDSHLGAIRMSVGIEGKSKYSKGTKTIGVYVPSADAKFHDLLWETWPAESEIVSRYEEGLKTAIAAPAGAPDCRAAAIP